MEAQNVNPALDLFSAPAMDESKENVHYIEHRPISNYKDGSPIEFQFKTTDLNYLYPKRSYLHLKFKIKKADGTKVGEDDKVAYANLPLHTFFKEIEVYANNVRVSSNVNYNYKSFINMLLNTDICEKIGYFQTQGYIMDDYDFSGTNPPNDRAESTSHSDSNKYKTLQVKENKTMEFIGPLFEDFWTVDRAILPETDIRLKLTRCSDAWFLYNCWKRTGTGATATNSVTDGDFKVSLEDVTFTACVIKVTPQTYKAHRAALEKAPAIYPVTKTELRVYNVPTGAETASLDHLFGGYIPKKVAVAMVYNSNFNGAKGENPTIFKNIKGPNTNLYIGGQRIGSRVDLTNDPMKAFHSMYTSYNLDHGIRYDQFQTGYNIAVFNVDPEIHNLEQLNGGKRGESRIYISFDEPLTKTVSCLIYAEYPSTMTIDKDGKVTV